MKLQDEIEQGCIRYRQLFGTVPLYLVLDIESYRGLQEELNEPLYNNVPRFRGMDILVRFVGYKIIECVNIERDI